MRFAYAVFGSSRTIHATGKVTFGDASAVCECGWRRSKPYPWNARRALRDHRRKRPKASPRSHA